VLSVEEEAVIVAFRRYTLLPLDDCLYALQPTIPHLTRSSLHRFLQRNGISRLPDVEGVKPAKKKFKSYPIGFFHIDIAEVRTEQGKLHMFVAIDRTSKFAYVELHENATTAVSREFLLRLIAAVPYKIHTVLTDNGIQFTTPGAGGSAVPLIKEDIANGELFWAHAFELACARNDIDHRTTKVKPGASTMRATSSFVGTWLASSQPTTSVGGSRRSRGSPLTSSFAKPGLPIPNASLSIRSSKCRD
jgi:hypothetical protein